MHDPGERAKDLRCLYQVLTILGRTGADTDLLFSELIDAIPAGWQYPDAASARLTIGGKEYTTGNFRETGWRLSAPVMVGGETDGLLEVCYSRDLPFLDEEGLLLSAISVQVSATLTQRRNEDDLREVNLRTRVMLDTISHAIYLTDTEGRFLLVNRAFEEMTGCTRAGIIGKTNEEVLPPDLAVLCTATDDLVREKRAMVRNEERVPGRDGAPLVYDITKAPLFDDSGEITGYAAAIIDITDRKRMEEALRESERLLSTLMGNLSGMAYRCHNDPGWTMELVSEGCLALTGYEPADLIGNRTLAYGDVIHPDDRDRVRSEVQAALEERRPFELRYRIITATGQEKWVWEQGVFTDAGDSAVIEGFITDITVQKHIEDALRESMERFRIAAESASDLIYEWDLESGGVMWFGDIGGLLGHAPGEFPGTVGAWEVMIHPEDRDRVIAARMRHIELGEPFCQEYRVIHRDGRVLHWRDAGSVLRETSGRPYKFIGVNTDVTAWKELEKLKTEAFIQIDRLFEQLAILNDEIRNPLSVIVAVADSMEDEDGKKILSQCDVINDTISRLDSGWLQSVKVRSFLKKHYGH